MRPNKFSSEKRRKQLEKKKKKEEKQKKKAERHNNPEGEAQLEAGEGQAGDVDADGTSDGGQETSPDGGNNPAED